MDLDSASNGERVTRPGKPYFAVLMSGLITTAVTLAGVYWLDKNTDDFHIMGWYANFVIPAGAMIVGLLAASGYAVASWLTGTRISKGLLLAVLLFQTGAYTAAEYVEYRDVMDGLKQRGLAAAQEPSFFQYYDWKARNFSWKVEGAGKQPGLPLGGWGYVFIMLGAAGFIGSGLLAPAVLYSVPYCENCQRYMKTKLLGVLPASIPIKKIAKRDQVAQAAHAHEQEQAGVNADKAITRLRAAIEEGRADTVKQELLAAGTIKANEKLPRRIRVSMIWCKSCHEGRVVVALAAGHAKALRVTKLGEAPVPAAFVNPMLDWASTPRKIAESDAARDSTET